MILIFKEGPTGLAVGAALYDYQDKYGFVFLNGHTREYEDEEYAKKLIKNYPKNFSEYKPDPIAPPKLEKKSEEKVAVEEKSIEEAPDKIMKEEKTKKKSRR